MAFEKGVLGQGGPTTPVYPANLVEGSPEMNAVRASRFVPPPPGLPGLAPTQNQSGAGAVTAAAVSNTGGWTVPTANPTTANWKAPDLAAYDQQYQSSIANTRAGIANQFQRAIEDITAQEGIANQVVGTLPGRYDEIWGGAQAQTTQGLQGLQAALDKSGLGGLMTAEQMNAPLQAALAGGKAGFQASVPLTQLGTQELFTRQKGALGQAKIGAETEVEKAVQDWIGRRAGIEADITARENEFRQREAERQAEVERFNAQQQAEHARSRAQLQSEERRFNASERNQSARSQADRSITPYQQATLDRDDRAFNASQAEKERERQAALPKFSSTQVGFQKGELINRENPKEAQKVRGSNAYKTLRTEFAKKFKNGVDDPQKARDFLLEKSKGRPWDRSVSLMLFDMGVDDSELGVGALRDKAPKEKGFGKGGWGWWR